MTSKQVYAAIALSDILARECDRDDVCRNQRDKEFLRSAAATIRSLASQLDDAKKQIDAYAKEIIRLHKGAKQ